MDLEFFMPPEKIPQALKALDVDGDGKISLADMRDAVIQVQTLISFGSQPGCTLQHCFDERVIEHGPQSSLCSPWQLS